MKVEVKKIDMEKLVDIDKRLDFLLNENEIKELKEENNRAYSEHNPIKSKHHSDWDKNILTLSTAAIGFLYGVLLPNTQNGDISYIWYASICFGLAIFATIVNYVFADETFLSSSKLIQYRYELIAELESCQWKREHSELIISSLEDMHINEKAVNETKEALFSQADKAREKYNKRIKYELNSIDSYSSDVNKLNIFKTLFFLLGILLTIGFAYVNYFM